MKKRTRFKHSIAGFTLIELLVVIIIIGILFAIAAPGWDTILSRQQVSAAREQVLQSIRLAQSQARSSRSPRVVVFDPNPSGNPRVAVAPYVPGTALPLTTTAVKTWQSLPNNSNTQTGAIKLATSGANSAIVFDSNGAVAQVPVVPASQFTTYSPIGSAFVVTVSRSNSTSTVTRRCVVINTLLGGTRLEEGAFNSTTGKGCPP